MRFLPGLFGGGRKPAPADTREEKLLLSNYYAGLVALGIDPSDRAREWSVDRAVADAYERVVWAFKAVEAISTSSSRLPYRLREGETVLDDHPMYRLMNKRANPLETGRQFRKRLSSQALLSKRGAFVETTLSRGGTPIRLDLLPPGRTLPVPGTGTTLVSHFEVRSVDGVKTREVPVDRVRWVREPHPLDPYSGVTPLEAAGLSVELDHYARAYNVTFMRNDGRPGQLVVVKGDAEDPILKSIEQKLDRGPASAGKTTVVTGDGVEVVDFAKSPRDVQYQNTSKNARDEILVAFGTPESVLGNASNRTFANADAEVYNFWTITMSPHNDLIVSAFDDDSDAALEGFLDTSSVEVLQRTALARREEARAEVAAGLRSIWSYAELAGMTDEIEDTIKTRALWLPSGKQPIPSREQDEQADAAASAAADTGSGDQLVSELMASVRAAAPPVAEPAVQAAVGGAAAGGGGNAPPQQKHAGRPALRLVIDRKAPPSGGLVEHSPDPRVRDRLDDALTAALQALAVRWVQRAAVKLGSAPARKGTRHWRPAGEYAVDARVGVKALDATTAIDPDRWSEEAQDAARPLVDQAAQVAAAALVLSLAGEEDEDVTGQAAAATVAAILALIGKAAARQAELLIGTVGQLDQDGADLERIVAAVRDTGPKLAGWAAGAAAQASTATVEDAQAGAAEGLSERQADATGGRRVAVTRQWFSRRDERVRLTHGQAKGADGQVQPLDKPFKVGAALLRFPGDPLGPAEEVANCRCYLRYRTARGVFTRKALLADPPPAGVDPDEWKARHVRTAAGASRYGLPIGAEIVGHPRAPKATGQGAGRSRGGSRKRETPGQGTLPGLDVTALGGRGRPDGAGTVDDPVDVHGDIDRAVQLLGEGKHIRLNRPREAGTLIKKLHDAVADLKAQGKDAPTFDLCKVSVPGTNLFCARHKGIPRAKMPQVAGRPQPGSQAAEIARTRGVAANGKVDLAPEFLAALAAAGVDVKQETIPASRLHASQMELDGETVAAIPEALRSGALPADARVAVTRDGYILDGHHRWAAQVYQGIEDGDSDISMRVDVLDMDIGAAIDFANDFAQRMGIAAETVGGPRPADQQPAGRRIRDMFENMVREGFSQEKYDALLGELNTQLGGPYGKNQLRYQAYTADPVSGAGDTRQMRVKADMFDPLGNNVGTVKRLYDFDAGTVEHELFELKDGPGGTKHQGQGVASEFGARSEDAYREMGIHRITLEANIDVGGYAWARQGYGWRTDGSSIAQPPFKAAVTNAGEIIFTAEQIAQKDGRKEELAGEFADLRRRLLAAKTIEDLPTPFELSRIGWSADVRMWPGKRAMLGTYWDAEKPLDDSPYARHLSEAHRTWTAKHADKQPVVPADAKGSRDYSVHHLDRSAPPKVEAEYQQLALEGLGLTVKSWAPGDSPAAAVDPVHIYAPAGPLPDDTDWQTIAEALYESPVSDEALAEIQHLQRFDGLPMAVDDAQLDALTEAGWVRLWRGVAGTPGQTAGWLEEWAGGPLLPGKGIAANGTYAYTRAEPAAAYAEPAGAVWDLALDPNAAVIAYEALQEEVRAARDGLQRQLAELVADIAARMEAAGSVEERERIGVEQATRQATLSAQVTVYSDPGRYAAARGYDAVVLREPHPDEPGEACYVILNRTATAVVAP